METGLSPALLRDVVHAGGVQLLGDHDAGHGKTVVHDHAVVRASRIVLLQALAVHVQETETALAHVERIAALAVAEIVQRRIPFGLHTVNLWIGHCAVRNTATRTPAIQRVVAVGAEFGLVGVDEGGTAEVAGLRLPGLVLRTQTLFLVHDRNQRTAVGGIRGNRAVRCLPGGRLVGRRTGAVAPPGVRNAVEPARRTGARNVQNQRLNAGERLDVDRTVTVDQTI